MPDRSLGTVELKECLFSACEYLEHNYDILNNLNVFPVPDGDTGTNMLATFEAGIGALRGDGVDTLQEIACRMNTEMIRSSRGNSGFIIARFFHGFFETVAREGSMGIEQLSAGFTAGLFQVNSSLFSPVEGTMLTVIRAVNGILAAMDRSESLRFAFEEAIRVARAALAETPRLLPVLAKAGVIDSGGLGFIFILEGFLRGLNGAEVVREREEAYRFPPDASVQDDSVDTRSFGYCTEVNVTRPGGIPREKVSRFLEERGNSIALVCEEDFLKVHIHTDVPAEIIDFMKTLGTVEHVKIDNLVEQVSRFSAVEDPEAECAVLAFIPGEGFRDIFASLGAAYCIHYSAHLPAAGEIGEYLENIQEKNIIVLPNNANILPAVMLAAEKTSKHISVIHTGTIIQGIAAAYGFSGNDGIEDNVTNMSDCMDMARGIFIYKSAAASEFDGRLIREGDYFALYRGNLAATGSSLAEVSLKSMKEAGVDEAMNIAIYFQNADQKNDLKAILHELTALNDEVEVEYLEGGQFRETLIISLE